MPQPSRLVTTKKLCSFPGAAGSSRGQDDEGMPQPGRHRRQRNYACAAPSRIASAANVHAVGAGRLFATVGTPCMHRVIRATGAPPLVDSSAVGVRLE